MNMRNAALEISWNKIILRFWYLILFQFTSIVFQVMNILSLLLFLMGLLTYNNPEWYSSSL